MYEGPKTRELLHARHQAHKEHSESHRLFLLSCIIYSYLLDHPKALKRDARKNIWPTRGEVMPLYRPPNPSHWTVFRAQSIRPADFVLFR